MLPAEDRTVTERVADLIEATALLLAREGARVVLVDVDAASLQAVAACIAAEGGTALPVHADVLDPAAVERLGAETFVLFGCGDLRDLDARRRSVPARRSAGLSPASLEEALVGPDPYSVNHDAVC